VTTSIAGKFGFPLRCGYSSSKFALYGFFETLQAEYYDAGIRVTLVCPGRVATNISKYALDKGGKPHGVMDPGQANGMSAEAAARIIVKAIKRGRREVLVGKKELLMVYIKRFFPGLCARLARKIKPM
jgi:short-subunit dehydrogenase